MNVPVSNIMRFNEDHACSESRCNVYYLNAEIKYHYWNKTCIDNVAKSLKDRRMKIIKTNECLTRIAWNKSIIDYEMRCLEGNSKPE